MSDMPEANGFSFTYKADSNQISFLQMLSSKASQNVTYHCSNSVAYHHDRRQHHRKAIALQTWNDLELRHRGKFKYKVLSDECQVRQFPVDCQLTLMATSLQFERPAWAETVFSVKDTKPQRLPIVDVAVRDIGNDRKKFKVELGPVCFT